jgi:raffinose/stachyose/melibiose transport system substrate-binding protein
MRISCKTSLVAVAVLLLANGTGAAQQATPVTITIWQNSSDTEAENNLYRAWEKKTGNKIDLVSIASASFIEATMTKWGTGSHPDILEWFADGAFLAGLNPDENLQPLDDLDFVKLSSGLYDNTGNWNGHVYAVLLHAPVLYGMFYNKEVLDQAGIKPPTTYAELKAACATLKQKMPDVAPIFQAGGSSWPLTVLPFNLWGGDFAYGQKIAYNEATFGAEGSPFVDALNKFVELQDAGCYNRDITTATEEDSARALVEGKAAILFQNTAEIVGLQAAAGSAEAMDRKIGFGSVGDENPTRISRAIR